ncbi:Probable thiol peroxidase [Candidatus Ornithobacterium hominis]|nr:Probable thiol peroxidase [Candidatus Ornithobacterium hominis]
MVFATSIIKQIKLNFMAEITLKGNKINTSGSLPEKGSQVKDVELINTDLERKKISGFNGKKLVFNIFPSVDTGVCAQSVRKFNESAGNKENTLVLCISKDLPFAQKRFCAAEGLDNVLMLSDFNSDFGDVYGCKIVDGPMQGLLSRAVIVTDENGKIVYNEQVKEITDEPNYDEALSHL